MTRPRKLSDEDVADIRRRVAAGEMQKVLAIEYGVSDPTISYVVNGKKAYVGVRSFPHDFMAMRLPRGERTCGGAS